MQGHRDLMEVARLIMSELTPLVSAQYGAFYLASEPRRREPAARVTGSPRTAWTRAARSASPGEGLVGQAAVERKPILVDDVPAPAT